MPLTAITREVSPTMEACELTHFARQPIDIGLARGQHSAYCDCLRALGVHVVTLPAEPEYPTFADGHWENVLGEAIALSSRERRWIDVEVEP